MLVLLIISWSRRLWLTVGVPLDLPQTQAKSSTMIEARVVNTNGEVFCQNTEIKVLRPCAEAPGDHARFFGAMTSASMCVCDKKVDYGTCCA